MEGFGGVVSRDLHFLRHCTVFIHLSPLPKPNLAMIQYLYTFPHPASSISSQPQIFVVRATHVGFRMALRRIGEVDDDDDAEGDGDASVGNRGLESWLGAGVQRS